MLVGELPKPAVLRDKLSRSPGALHRSLRPVTIVPGPYFHARQMCIRDRAYVSTSGPVSVRCCQHFSRRGFGTICPKVPAFVEGDTMPKYYPINEEAAKRAKDMNSFSDYQPGSATTSYRAMVDEAYAAAERQKARVDPMYHDKIDALVDRYARKLAENLNERNVIDARVPSILISGGGNFPVAKKHKQNAARDRNYGEYAEISKLLDKIRSVGMGGISADDDLAVEKLTKKLEGLESLQATMKAVNAYFRKHKTLDGCPELTPEQAEKLKADMAQSWHLDKSKPYPAYLLSNNNANIRRVRQRIEELSSRSEFAGWTFPGGEAKINEAENRLDVYKRQILYSDTEKKKGTGNHTSGQIVPKL